MARTRRLSLSVRRVVPGSPGTPAITPPPPPLVPPVFTSITPNTIASNTSGSYAILGDRLTAAQILSSLPAGVTASALTITDAQHATVTLIAAPGATVGAANIRIHDDVNGDSGTVALTVTAGVPVGTARAALYPVETAAAGTLPAASKSTTLPLATHFGALSWRVMDIAKGSSGQSPYVQMTGGGATQSGFIRGWMSVPLSDQIIPAGNYTLSIGGTAESGSPYKYAPVVYVYRPSTDAVVGVIHDSAVGIGSVFTNSALTGGKVLAMALAAPFPIQLGDCLAIELHAVGTGNDYLHAQYNGNIAVTEGGDSNDAMAALTFPAPIYTAPSPMGMLRVGPTGISSGTGVIAAVPVANDAEYRSKMIPAGAGNLWDPAQTTRNGSAAPGVLSASEMDRNDLQIVDTVVTVTDRDAIARNTLHCLIRPNGGAPLDPSKDANASSSNVPQAAYHLPAGRTITSWYHRRLYRFKAGFRLDCPNNAVSNATGFNQTQSGAYKMGPHPANDVTRADLEITGGQNFGTEYMTGNFGAWCTTDNNYIIGSMSTLMPGWNTAEEWWEIIRVMRDHGDGTATHAVYIGKLTDALLTRVISTTRTLDTTKNTVWPAMNAINITGKNFNRQLASTDATPELWVNDTEWADITEPGFTWPAQIAVADRI